LELKHRVALISAFLLLAGPALAGGPTPDEAKDDSQFYHRQVADGIILPATSAQQRLVNTFATRINKIAAPMYGARFVFLATNEQEVNAAAYAPHVYVSKGIISYVHNADELAAVLCHEVSHAIHHDGQYGMLRDARIAARTDSAKARIVRILHGHLQGKVESLTSTAGVLAMMHYSRSDEERADLTGSEICARAGYNPWGAVWLFQTMLVDYPSMHESRWMADHPNFKKRIGALKKHFKHNKALFGHYQNDITKAAPLT